MLPAQFFALKSECQEGVSAAQTGWLLTRCVDAVIVSGTWNLKVLVTIGEYNAFYVIGTYIGVNQKLVQNSNVLVITPLIVLPRKHPPLENAA